MMNRILNRYSLRWGIMAMCAILLFAACEPKAEEENSKTESELDSVEHEEEKLDPGMIVPGKSVGLVTKNMSEEELRLLFNGNISRSTLPIQEELKIPATVVSPGSGAELWIIWRDTSTVDEIERIIILNQMSHYATKNGVKIGMGMDELVNLNKKEIHFYGFDWEESGLVTNFGNGKLDSELNLDKGIALNFALDTEKFSYTQDEIEELSGAHELQSDFEILIQKQPYLKSISVLFN